MVWGKPQIIGFFFYARLKIVFLCEIAVKFQLFFLGGVLVDASTHFLDRTVPP
jgi:hypothetical protein